MRMRMLVLGGTSFVGRAVVEDALDAGVDVTLFSRGRTNPHLFPGVARLVGDRDTGDYGALRSGSWDAVVDVSGYVPRHVGQAMDALGDRAGRYLFVSSQAVYAGREPAEDAALKPPVRGTEELTEATYGGLKAACEEDVRTRYGTRATVVRPGKVAGPHDDQRGLTYWARRAARGGRVALPGRPGQPVQLVDSRDLARLVVRLAGDDREGAFNAVGPAEPVTLADVVHTCADVAGARVEIVPVPPVPGPGSFPLVRPEAQWHTQRRSAARARAAGMPATPLARTVADVLAWDRGRGEPPLGHGLTAEAEEELLGRI